MTEQWVKRFGFEIDPESVAPGVFRVKSGGFLARYRSEGKTRLRRLNVDTVGEAVVARRDLKELRTGGDDADRPLRVAAAAVPMNSTAKGVLSEAAVTTRLIQAGYQVLRTVTVERYDLVVVPPGTDQFRRVQIKTGRLRDGFVEFHVSSVDYGRRTRSSYVGEVEDFAVYCPANDVTYLVPAERVRSTTIARLRTTAPRNGSSTYLRATDFVLPTVGVAA